MSNSIQYNLSATIKGMMAQWYSVSLYTMSVSWHKLFSFALIDKIQYWVPLVHMQSPIQAESSGWNIFTLDSLYLNILIHKTLQTLGLLHSVTKVKYSSPIFLISNNPAWVPTSDSLSSSVRLTMVPPQALARRLLSVLRNLEKIL